MMSNPIFDVYLVDGNITIFCGAHSESFKNDILDSSLLAILETAKQSKAQELSWSTYTDYLGKFGWVLNSRSTQMLGFCNNNLLEVVEQGMGSDLPNDEQQAIADAFSALTRLENESCAVKAFIKKLQQNATTSTDSSASISTATLLTIVYSDKTLMSLQIAFETSPPLEMDILDKPRLISIDNGENNFRLMRSSLNERQYTEFRAIIRKKLGQKIETELLHIPLPTDE
jgi:hypothetical protein